MAKEIIFSYNNMRCHATVSSGDTEGYRYIGCMDEYDIYQEKGIWFDQFGFIAIKRGEIYETISRRAKVQSHIIK